MASPSDNLRQFAEHLASGAPGLGPITELMRRSGARASRDPHGCLTAYLNRQQVQRSTGPVPFFKELRDRRARFLQRGRASITSPTQKAAFRAEVYASVSEILKSQVDKVLQQGVSPTHLPVTGMGGGMKLAAAPKGYDSDSCDSGPETEEDENFSGDSEDSDSEDDDLVCEICHVYTGKSSEAEKSAIVCDGCNNKCAHQRCLGISTIPEGDWFCKTCSASARPPAPAPARPPAPAPARPPAPAPARPPAPAPALGILSTNWVTVGGGGGGGGGGAACEDTNYKSKIKDLLSGIEGRTGFPLPPGLFAQIKSDLATIRMTTESRDRPQAYAAYFPKLCVLCARVYSSAVLDEVCHQLFNPGAATRMAAPSPHDFPGGLPPWRVPPAPAVAPAAPPMDQAQDIDSRKRKRFDTVEALAVIERQQHDLELRQQDINRQRQKLADHANELRANLL